MKIKRLYAAAALLLLLPACRMMGPESGTAPGPEGKAAVRIGIGIQGRTVLPSAELTDVTAWELWGGSSTESETLLTNFSGTTATVYLETGAWNFTLKGYNGNDELILQGAITNKTITLEGPNDLAFEVAPLAEGQGVFSITVNLPPGHGITAAEVRKDGVKITDPAPVLTGDTVSFEGAYAAGDYYFSLRLYKGADLYGVVSELAQVRGNLWSEKTYTLSPEDLSRTYVITYHRYDAVIDTGYYWTGGNFTLPIPAREHYVFESWYDNPGYTGSPVTLIPQGSTGDKDFYARWTAMPPGSHIVTFKLNDSTETDHAVKIVTPPAAAIAAADFPANPARTEYVFAGWNTQAGGGGSAFTASTPVSADTTVYAHWTAVPPGSYTVIFKLNDGTETHYAVRILTPPEALIDAGDFPADPFRGDSIFAGWNTQADGGGSPFTASVTVTGDTTVYAHWISGAFITLNLDAGSGAFSQDTFTVYKSGGAGSQTLSINGSGYTSPRWFVDGDLKGTGTSITINAADYDAGGHTLTLLISKGGVSWSKALAFTVDAGTLRGVVFRTNDGTGAIYALKTTAAGSSLDGDFPAAPARTGYDFTGWNTQAGGLGSGFTASTPVNADTTVYAQWTAHTYTVSFDKNGGDTEADPTAKTVTFPAAYLDALPAPPARTDYAFAGWNTQADGSGTAFTASTPVVANITVYAQWVHAEFAITLNLDAGSGAFSQDAFTIYKSGGTGNQTLTVTGSGYTNPRWFVDGELKGTGTSITLNAADYGAGDHSLTLLISRGGVSWSKALAFTVDAGTLRRVVFRTNDGTGAIYALKTTAAGSSLDGEFPANPTRTGYDFTGWNTQAGGLGSGFTATDTVNADTTVYAQWTAHTYTVSFDKNGGDTEADPTAKTVIFPAAYLDALPVPPARANYTFAGWNTQADGSGTAFTASTPVTANITVYAQWAHADFAITLNLDAGSGAFSQDAFTIYKSGGTGSQTVTITGSGYTNPRWFVDGDLQGTGTSIEINAADYGAGGHALTLLIRRGGVSWSKELTFTISINP